MGTDAKGLIMEQVNFVGLGKDESEELFDKTTRKNMQLSGDEFLKNWNSGEYDGIDWDDVPGLTEVVCALPFTSKPRRNIQEVCQGE